MIAALALFAAHEGTLVVGDRTELRVRDSGFGVAADLETLPSAAVRYRTSRHTSVYAGAFPRLTLRSDADFKPDLLAAGQAGAEYHDRHLALYGFGEASYGDQNFTGLALPVAGEPGGPPAQGTPGVAPGPALAPTVQQLPAARAILFESARASLGTTLSPGRGWWTVSAGASYGMQGGADEASRAFFPRQYGPRADASVVYRADRRDDAVTLGDAERITFSYPGALGPIIDELDAEEAWRRRWTRNVDTQIGGGASFVRVQTNLQDHEARVRPHPLVDAQGGSHWGWQGGRADVRLILRLSPVVNRITAGVDERAQITLISQWRRDRWRARAILGASQPVPETDPSSGFIGQTELAASYQTTKRVAIEFGARGAVAESKIAGLSPLQWVVFVAMIYQEPTLHF